MGFTVKCNKQRKTTESVRKLEQRPWLNIRQSDPEITFLLLFTHFNWDLEHLLSLFCIFCVDSNESFSAHVYIVLQKSRYLKSVVCVFFLLQGWLNMAETGLPQPKWWAQKVRHSAKTSISTTRGVTTWTTFCSSINRWSICRLCSVEFHDFITHRDNMNTE